MPIFECSRCNDMTYSASVDAAQPCARCGHAGLRIIEGGFREARQTPRDLGPGDHATLVYDDPNQVAPFCTRYLTEGIDRGDHVLAALPKALGKAVRRLLAPDVEAIVEWVDTAEIYGDFDADRVLAYYAATFAANPGTTRVLAGIDGDCARGVDAADFDRLECMGHALIVERGASAVCLYDAGSLSDPFVAIAARRHALAVDDGVVRRNEQFEYAG